MQTIKNIGGLVLALAVYLVLGAMLSALLPEVLEKLYLPGALAILVIGILIIRNPSTRSFKTGSLKDVPKERVKEIRRIAKNWESWMQAAGLAHEATGKDGKTIYSYPVVRSVRDTTKGIELDIYPLIGTAVSKLIQASELLAPALGREIEPRQDAPTHATWLVVMSDPLAGVRTFTQGESR